MLITNLFRAKKLNPMWVLLLASFVSQAGSYLLTLALSAFVRSQSGSSVKAAWVFIVSSIAPALLSPFLGKWIDKKISRRFWISNELFACLGSFLCGVCVSQKVPWALTCLVLSIRSIFGFMSRSYGLKYLKAIIPIEKQANQVKLFYAAFYLATAFAGALATLLLQKDSLWKVVFWDIVTYLVGAALLFLLPPLQQFVSQVQITSKSAFSFLPRFSNHPALLSAFLWVLLVQMLFQAAYSVLVTQLPKSEFPSIGSGVGLYQISASFGILLGFLINWFFPYLLVAPKKWYQKWIGICVVASGVGSVLFSTWFAASHHLLLSLFFFFLLNFFFEWIWLYHTTQFFANTPKEKSAQYQFFLSAFSSLGMACSIWVYAYFIERSSTWMGVVQTISILLLLAICGMSISWVNGRAAKKANHKE